MRRLIAALLILAGPIPAGAAPRGPSGPDRYDGLWSVVIITESGACDRAYRYPVRIEHGSPRLVGTIFELRGTVTVNGTVRGSIANGTASADVRGRLG